MNYSQKNGILFYKGEFVNFHVILKRDNKWGIYNDYEMHKDVLQDLIMFKSSHEGKLVTLKEYVSRMKEDQKKIYFASGETVEKIALLPQVESVKAPGFGDRRKEMLVDIATLTSGEVITSDLGLDLKDTTLGQLGRARQVKVTKENIIIVGGYGDKIAITERVAQIKVALETTTSEFDKEKLTERLAKLAGGVAVIKVGAATEVEMKEKKLRIEDALNATKAAVEEGIVAGGGAALVNVIGAVEKVIETLDVDEKTGAMMVVKALTAPMRQIADNAGIDGSVVVAKVRENGKAGYGLDAYTEQFCDMIEACIVDPAKVTRSALQNAASIASTVLTTEAVVSTIKEPTPPVAPNPEMGGMY